MTSIDQSASKFYNLQHYFQRQVWSEAQGDLHFFFILLLGVSFLRMLQYVHNISKSFFTSTFFDNSLPLHPSTIKKFKISRKFSNRFYNISLLSYQ